MNDVQAILIFVVIPAAVFVAIGVAVYAPSWIRRWKQSRRGVAAAEQETGLTLPVLGVPPGTTPEHGPIVQGDRETPRQQQDTCTPATDGDADRDERTDSEPEREQPSQDDDTAR